MAAGLGFKTFQTGEVLTAADTNGYLMQGVLVFANAAARDAAITSPEEGQCCYLKDTDAVLTYSGTAWVGFDDSNAIQNAIINAKGDLIAGSANDTPAILSAGANGDTLVADSSATTGLRYQEPKAGNPTINAAFQVWQRGTSFTANTGYTADRWYKSAAAGRTFSRQTTSDTTNLPNIQYCLRMQRDSGNATTDNVILSQSFESVNAIPFAGKVVTLSFYARAGANYSPTSGNFIARLYTGTGTDQNVEVSYTGSSAVINQASALTTTWQRFSYTGTIGTSATEFALWFAFTPVGTAGAADYAEITGVQVEVGSVATPFKTQGVTLAGELAACQRYYQKSFDQATAPAQNTSAGNILLNASVYGAGTNFFIRLPVVMRVAPTVTTYNPFAANASWRLPSSITDVAITMGNINDNTICGSTTNTAATVMHAHFAAVAEL